MEAREGRRQNEDLLDAVLYHLAESLRIIAIWISPVLPKAAHGIFDQLNWKMELSGKEERFSLADAEWGRLPDGHVVGKPVPLFPRIEIEQRAFDTNRPTANSVPAWSRSLLCALFEARGLAAQMGNNFAGEMK